jgi:hypothetical protein
MKKSLILLVGLISICLLAGVVFAAVSGSPHDLRTGTATEICAFCHTPHSAGDPALTGPLWNRSQASQSYTPYTSATFDMGAASEPKYGSGACLTCHNGVTSGLVNYPGPGSIATANYTFIMGTAPYNSTYATWANLGIDLSNDHPVGFTYNASLDDTTDNNGFPATISTVFRLFGAGKDQFECGTCHAVHDTGVAAGYSKNPWDNTTKLHTATTGQVYFLRSSNAASALCIACHVNR